MVAIASDNPLFALCVKFTGFSHTLINAHTNYNSVEYLRDCVYVHECGGN